MKVESGEGFSSLLFLRLPVSLSLSLWGAQEGRRVAGCGFNPGERGRGRGRKRLGTPCWCTCLACSYWTQVLGLYPFLHRYSRDSKSDSYGQVFFFFEKKTSMAI